MVQVSYPGVYIEEVPSGVHTITSVSTSIAAFFGRTKKGPLNKAVRCLSLADFNRNFGGAHPKSDLAQSVRQFFANGGTDCYVVRLAHEAKKADITLQGIDSITNVLKATAKYAGNLGNGIRLEIDYGTMNQHDTFNLKVIQEDDGVEQAIENHINLSMAPNSPRFAPDFVTQSSDIINLDLVSGFDIETATSAINGYSESRRPFDVRPGADFHTKLNDILSSAGHFEISVNGERYISIDLSGLTITHVTSGDFKDEAAIAIQNEINTQLGAAIAGLTVGCGWDEHIGGDYYVLRISSDSGNHASVRIRQSSENDLAGPMMLGTDQSGIEVTRYSSFRPVATATVLNLSDVNTIAYLQQDAFNQVTVGGVDVDLETDLQTSGASDRWFQDGSGSSSVTGNSDGIREKLEIIARKVNENTDVECRAEVWGYYLAFIPTSGSFNDEMSVATSNAGGGGTDIATHFTVNTRQYALGNTGTSIFQDGSGTKGLDDDGNPPNRADYIGDSVKQTGFHALDPLDLFNLMVIPGDEDAASTIENLWGSASNYCIKRRAFLLIDAPAGWTGDDNGQKRPVVKENINLINDLRRPLGQQGAEHAAVFYPRLKYRASGLSKTIGPSGAIAGLMARIDSSRGVWKAPAGIEAGIREIEGLEVKLTDPENGVLNKKGVNCLRVFPNGFVNWGGRTLYGDDDFGSEWKYIPIRRLALMMEEALFRGTKWVVFEPNDESLWAQIRMNINAYMMSLFRQGAFQGTSPKEAFYVKCDKETTTQDDRNKGIVNIEVGFAPLKPAEFVVIKVQQMAGEL